MKKYSHVIVVGIDGAGSFIEKADTPHFDRIFQNGAVTYRALSSNPSASAECWGSMLLGVGPEDTEQKCRYLAEKALGLRVFEDENGKMNLSLADVGGSVLVVSQFTLYGNCRKGRRPSFTEAANPELGNRLYEQFLKDCEALGFKPQHGRFGADMQVALINDGPVTILMDTDIWNKGGAKCK